MNTADTEVSWQLISNFIEPANQFEAKFILTNKGNEDLSDSSWAMFFNVTPRGIKPTPTPQPANVEHINGDWYKLVPNKGFRLKPGETIEVLYRSEDFVIKETDAPLGCYIVFYDGKGAEKNIVQLGDAKVLPFTTREQQLRGKSDMEPIQGPGYDFEKNQSMSPVTASQLIPVIPEPVKYTIGTGTFNINSSTIIYAEKGLESEAELLSSRLKMLCGLDCKISADPAARGGIRLRKVPLTVNGIKEEAYKLIIISDGIEVSGSDKAGVFYGTQSLLSLIPVAAMQNLRNADVKSNRVALPVITIEDAPGFSFRGLHIDVGRNFQTKETIFRLIDMLAFYKINQVLFYATEDEGWRIEIDGLPELTEVGAKRSHLPGMKSPGLHPAYGSGPDAGSKDNHGSGYYTKSDFIEILKYSQSRHINIIPELNFPGHARAAIKSMEARYEKLMKAGKAGEAEEYRLTDPDDKSVYFSAQGYKDNVVDITKPSVYHFYEKVMDEFIKMYAAAGLKLEVIHMGGDEVPDGAWTKSAAAMEKFNRDPGMDTYKNFHAYFVRNLLPLLQKRNLTVHAWEEAALLYKKGGGYQVNPEFSGGKIIPYIWNNVYDPDLGYRMANAGYPIILCNVTNFYFDLAYTNSSVEPGQYWAGFVDTRDAFTFDPYNMFNTTYTNSMGKPMVFNNVEKLKPEARRNILGVEAEIWSETIKGRDMLEYYYLPKLMGYAQSAWCTTRAWENVADSNQREKIIQEKWNLFANTIAVKDLPRLSYMNGGYNYRIPPPGAIIENGELKANTSMPGLTIRYTTDGTEPVMTSPLYTGPVKTAGKIMLRSFDAAGKGSRLVNL
jgi:hexosaminidase